MIKVTPRAARHLVRMRRSRGFSPKAGARFVRMSNGVGISIFGRPKPDDRVIEATGIDVYAGRDVAEKLEGSILDATEQQGATELVLRTPPSEGTRRSAEGRSAGSSASTRWRCKASYPRSGPRATRN
jgi:Fe-S cluster assembly iron-binding protein IscA